MIMNQEINNPLKTTQELLSMINVEDFRNEINSKTVITEEIVKEKLRQKLEVLAQNNPIVYKCLKQNRAGYIDYQHALLMMATALAEINSKLQAELLDKMQNEPAKPFPFLIQQ